jgi:hypothetical protein
LIVLSNEKELIPVESWEQICERAGFTNSLDPAEHELKAILGSYTFPAKVPCGLSNCQTPHFRGYIVATKDGRETNIGNHCGKKFFGVDFEEMAAKYDRDLLERQNRERVWAFVSQRAEAVATRINELRGGTFGGDWVYKTIRPLVEGLQIVPGKVVRKLAEMAKTGQTTLTQEREANEQELAELDRGAGRRVRRPHIISVPIAQVAGLDALASDFDIKRLLVIELAEPLRELKATSIDSLDFESLKRWSRWVSEVDGKLERAAASIEKGRRLLTVKNLTPFRKAISLDHEESVRFDNYLDKLPA